MLRLVSPGAEGEAVRTRVPRRLVAPAHDELVEALVAARLVTSDEDVLEITHEALTRAWPRLRGWLDDDVDGQRIRHHLSGAADAWDTLARPDSELYRGVRLTRALDWQSRTEPTLTDTERAFLHAARESSDAEERSAAEQAKRAGPADPHVCAWSSAAPWCSWSSPSRPVAWPRFSPTGRETTPRTLRRQRSPRTPGASGSGRSSPTTSASRSCSPPRAHGWTTRRRPGSTC